MNRVFEPRLRAVRRARSHRAARLGIGKQPERPRVDVAVSSANDGWLRALSQLL